MPPVAVPLAAAVLLLPFAAAASRARAPEAQPFVVVLGTAQDGGLPQAGCEKDCCRRARRSARHRRLVASLLVVDPRNGRRWLIDATPDLPEQLARADEIAPRPEGAPPRLPFDGVFLTHAHVGHYAGLVHLGREVIGARGVPLYGTARMRTFLLENGPWDQLVRLGNVVLRPIVPDRAVSLADDLTVTPILVPHRDEYSDTVGFVIAGPNRSLLYIPDIDKWERWDTPLEEALAGVDVALLDATFHDGDELPGRDMASIPHPFVVETLERLENAPEETRAKVVLTHLNHSNPVAARTSRAARTVRAAGLRVASEGDVHPL